MSNNTIEIARSGALVLEKKYGMSNEEFMTPMTFTVGRGETLFKPNDWWHTACSLTSTISVALDALNDTYWAKFKKELAMKLSKDHPLIRKATLTYLSILGNVLHLSEIIGLKAYNNIKTYKFT